MRPLKFFLIYSLVSLCHPLLACQRGADEPAQEKPYIPSSLGQWPLESFHPNAMSLNEICPPSRLATYYEARANNPLDPLREYGALLSLRNRKVVGSWDLPEETKKKNIKSHMELIPLITHEETCSAVKRLSYAPTLLTHHRAVHNEFSDTLVKDIDARLCASQSLYLPLEEERALLGQMTEFELGRFLLQNGGINGYWTAYWLIHGPQKMLSHPLENWLINKAPSFIASRERAAIFKRETQTRLKDGMHLASVPCGLMDDLVRLDYTAAPTTQLFGYDLDEESLSLAKTNAGYHAPSQTATFYCTDAWHLPQDASFDLLTSNGLNFYVAEDADVTNLYRTFWGALKPGGILITSFLTPPPTLDDSSKWQQICAPDMQKQMAIFKDLISAKWTALRSEAQTRVQLYDAGFMVEEVIYDSQGLFPTVIARKLS